MLLGTSLDTEHLLDTEYLKLKAWLISFLSLLDRSMVLLQNANMHPGHGCRKRRMSMTK